jgi:peptidoglycan/xylan/chitin deacetylase (PgdA/CDA1 family)
MSHSLQYNPALEREPARRASSLARSDRPTASSAPPTGSRWAAFGELRNGLAARGLGLLPAFCQPRIAGGFGILMYHRVVASPAGVKAPTWNVAPERFRAQMTGLLRAGYRPWPLRKVLADHRSGRPIPPKTFIVTFDDIYENVYLNAFPVLREHKIPATVFLTTAFLDAASPFPFDDWSCAGSPSVPAETWRPITTPQCREMQASGLIELAAHTHEHADFRGRAVELGRDLAVSLQVLRERFGVTEASFAFPFGRGCRHEDGPELSEVARHAGTVCALTTESELVRPGDNPWNWGRFAALSTDSAASLIAKLDGRYSLARSAWRRLRRRAGAGRQPVQATVNESFNRAICAHGEG